MNLSMIWALKLTQIVEEGLVPCTNNFGGKKKWKGEIDVVMYFGKVILTVPASPASPSTSSTFSASAIPGVARPVPPPPPPPRPPRPPHPPQPAQREDNEGEYLYDDLFPLNDE